MKIFDPEGLCGNIFGWMRLETLGKGFSLKIEIIMAWLQAFLENLAC
jgi:hypothetical protein